MSDKDKENQRLHRAARRVKRQDRKRRDRANALGGQLDEQKKITNDALAKVELLNQQLAALRLQLAALQEALDASEAKDKESQAKIADLGQRLNVALAKKVQELSRYRSDFFGKLQRGARQPRRTSRSSATASCSRPTCCSIRARPMSGPRPRRSSTSSPPRCSELETQIPPDIAWVMRVDGHTDIKPIATPAFPSNWELSAARAISVVRYLIEQGMPANRLVAAGFGEFQPIDAGDSDEAYARTAASS